MKLIACLVLAALSGSEAFRPNFNPLICETNLKRVQSTLKSVGRSIPAVVAAALLISPMGSQVYSSASAPSSYSVPSCSPHCSPSYPAARLNYDVLTIPANMHTIMHTTMLVSDSEAHEFFGIDLVRAGKAMTVGVSVASAAYYFITGVDSDTVFNVLMIANISVLALYFFLLGATVGLKEGEQEGLKEGEKEGALGQGATVITLRVAVDSDWTQDNIMQTLSRLRKDPDKKHSKYPSLYALEITQTRATLLADTCVALLRKRSSWSAVSVQGQQKPQAKVQLYFEELAVAEQVRNIPYEQKSGTWYDVRPTREAWSFTREALSRAQFHFKIPVRGSTSTTAVVSMVVAVRGWSKALGGGSEADVAGALQTLAAEARAEGGNIAGLELLWTPSEWGVTLDDRDMLLEYPELMSL